MNTLSQSKWSSAGMILGAVALMLSVFHFTVGPFTSPTQTLEHIVAHKVSAVKTGIIAGLRGEVPPVTDRRSTPDIDALLDNAGIGMAIIALLCAFIGGIRKESAWSVSGAMLFGGSTLAFYAFLLYVGLICTVLLIFLVVSWFAGPPV
ncbi:hypothetical protein [Pantoea phytobeneficialis]|uniref:Inner membrane protein yidI n=1 Tax=Pantoea phytobeneficialis TaxID=2052056 RepID=A0AAP9KRY9_9GAMM|nr:hypothetical protein [Pantoea phytobeneficialis]MDO6406471.1 hypothetical protein [Pantoea phytobeneficialis]QGR09569.1 hypothetical protein CTZ24_24180 [Pantoea phytobeneficialis]